VEIVAVRGTRADALDHLKKNILKKDHRLDPRDKDPFRMPFKRPSQFDAPEFVDYAKHEVQFTDTLPGLAIKYNTNVAKLKQINKLFTNEEMHKLKYLLVPLPGAVTKGDAPPCFQFSPSYHIQKLLSAGADCPEEAVFYLEDNGWDLELARESMEEDMEWAQEELRKRKGKLREFLGDGEMQTVAVVAAGAVIVLLCVVL